MIIRLTTLLIFLLNTSLLSAQSVSDYDGNVYPVITIGNQQWIGKNLRTTHFNDGTPLVNAGISNWYFLPTHEPRYAMPLLIPGSSDSISTGMWYNYPAAGSSLNLCPTGWRVANDFDWSQLIHTLDSNASDTGTLESTIAGGLLKDTTLWVAPNTGAVNAVGFSILPVSAISGSIILPAGHVCCSGLNASFWCGGTPWSPGIICYDRYFSWSAASVIRNTDTYTNGKSVRCVKDLPAALDLHLRAEHSVLLSPNPATDFLIITVDRPSLGTILIYDQRGALLKQFHAPGSSFRMDVADLSRGMYFLSLPDLKQNKKLIVE